MRLDIHILAPSYLKEGKPCFTKVTEEYKKKLNKDDAEKESIDLEEKVIKKSAQCKEKRNAWTVSLIVSCLSCHLPVLRSSALLPGSSTPLPRSSALLFSYASGVCMPGSSALSASGTPIFRSFAPPSLSSHLLVPGLSAPSAFGAPISGFFAPPFSSSRLPVPRSSTPSTSDVPVPGSFALLSLSGYLPVPGLFALFVFDILVPRSSAPLFPSGRLPVPESFAPSTSGAPVPRSFTPPSPFGCLPMPRSSAPSTSGVLIPGSSALLSPFSRLPVPKSFAPSPSSCLLVPGLSLPGLSPPFSIWSSLQTPTPILGKQRLGQWD